MAAVQDFGHHAAPGFLDRSRTIARPGFNRWLLPPAALAIHLSIGMAYGFGVFWLPLSQALGSGQAAQCPDLTLLSALFTTVCNWRISDLGWVYTLFFVFLGCSAAIWGTWLEHAGPRKAAFAAALCWSGGIVLAAFGVFVHQLWLIWLGAGVIGGIGLGLGYISPVSTLIKWFPDRRGMATGMAIMGFGGGALIGAPLADLLMKWFRNGSDPGVWQTFLVFASGYFIFMMAGAFGYRVPPADWQPAHWTPPKAANALYTPHHVHVKNAHKSLQFWLIWLVLCLNVSAGIGIIGIASPMLQEIFGGALIGAPGTAFSALSADQLVKIAAIGAGFTGLLSLFNIAGRFFWSALSDRIGRKGVYFCFFAFGASLYAVTPMTTGLTGTALFVASLALITSMFGGGFAAVAAYLADIFGTKYVGAIHGRILTAWSVAGIIGPVLVNYIREYELARGVPAAQAYDVTMYVLAGMLVLGLLANALVRPLPEHFFMDHAEVEALKVSLRPPGHEPEHNALIGVDGLDGKVILAWSAVVLPLLWGFWATLQKASLFFG